MKKKILKSLRKPLLYTLDQDWADKSIFQWAPYKDESWECYSLSALGMINGILPLLPGSPVLVLELDEETNEPSGKAYFKRKWW